MTQINLPNKNVTGDNLWSQVEGNDQAIADVVNGQIGDDNVTVGANISGAKMADGSLPIAKLIPSVASATKNSDQVVASGSATDVSSLSFSLSAGVWLVVAIVPVLTDSATAGALILNEAGTAIFSVPWQRFAAGPGNDIDHRVAGCLRTVGSTSTMKTQLQVTSGIGATVKAGASMFAVRLG